MLVEAVGMRLGLCLIQLGKMRGLESASCPAGARLRGSEPTEPGAL